MDNTAAKVMFYIYVYIRGATVQIAHGTVRTSVFGPRSRFGFGTCFVQKETAISSQKYVLFFSYEHKQNVTVGRTSMCME